MSANSRKLLITNHHEYIYMNKKSMTESGFEMVVAESWCSWCDASKLALCDHPVVAISDI
jgi:hypothetical protein